MAELREILLQEDSVKHTERSIAFSFTSESTEMIDISLRTDKHKTNMSQLQNHLTSSEISQTPSSPKTMEAVEEDAHEGVNGIDQVFDFSQDFKTHLHTDTTKFLAKGRIGKEKIEQRGIEGCEKQGERLMSKRADLSKRLCKQGLQKPSKRDVDDRAQARETAPCIAQAQQSSIPLAKVKAKLLELEHSSGIPLMLSDSSSSVSLSPASQSFSLLLKVLDEVMIDFKDLNVCSAEVVNRERCSDALRSENRKHKVRTGPTETKSFSSAEETERLEGQRAKLAMKFKLVSQDLAGCEKAKKELEGKLMVQKAKYSKWLKEKEVENNKCRSQLTLRDRDIKKLKLEINRLKDILDKAQRSNARARGSAKSTQSSRPAIGCQSQRRRPVNNQKSQPQIVKTLEKENERLRKELGQLKSLSSVDQGSSSETVVGLPHLEAEESIAQSTARTSDEGAKEPIDQESLAQVDNLPNKTSPAQPASNQQ